MVLFGAIFVIFKGGELILVVSESSFGRINFRSLLFDFSASQVMTSAVSIAKPLVLFPDSTLRLPGSFVRSLNFY